MKLVPVVVLLLTVGHALPQEQPERAQRPSIRVTGEATVTVKPDQVLLDVGVLTQAPTAQAATSQNAQRLDNVLSELRKILGAAADIKTVSYSVTPNYRYPKDGGNPTVSGYSASNTVQIKTSDLAKIGQVIDLATQSGANTIQRLHFMLKDEQNAQSQALREAAAKAKAKADALVSALGLRFVRVLFVEEGASPVRPFAERSFAMARADVAQTPVEPGTIDIRAVVTLTVEISQ